MDAQGYFRGLPPLPLKTRAVPVYPSSLPAVAMLLQSDPGDASGENGNTGTLYFGSAEFQSQKLNPGDSIIIPCRDVSEIWVRSTVVGDLLLPGFVTIQGGFTITTTITTDTTTTTTTTVTTTTSTTTTTTVTTVTTTTTTSTTTVSTVTTTSTTTSTTTTTVTTVTTTSTTTTTPH